MMFISLLFLSFAHSALAVEASPSPPPVAPTQVQVVPFAQSSETKSDEGEPTAQASPQAPPASLEEMTNVRDPFKRPMTRNATGIAKTELEEIPVEKLKMIGVLTGLPRLRAMVQGPNGKTYFVSERTPVGVRQGVITRITPDTIVVREKIVNVLGKEESADFEIKLPSDTNASLKSSSSLKQGLGW
jgi:Tfp pilus assembly protein PilP